MTDEQILKLALKHLFPYDESGELQWWGKEEQLLKFAKEMYNKGRYNVWSSFGREISNGTTLYEFH